VLYDKPPSWPRLSHAVQDFHDIKEVNLNESAPVGAIFAFQQEKHLLAKLQNVRVLPLSDLVNFMQIAQSPAAHHGKLIFGTAGNSRILVVSSSDRAEGFSDVESFYLAVLCRLFGVAVVASTFHAISVGDSNHMMVLNDLVDRSRNLLPPHLAEFSKAFGGASNARVFDSDLGGALVGSSGGKFQLGALMYFPGPSIPSPAEVHCATFAGCSAVGFSNLLFTVASSVLGLRVCAVASVVKYDNFPDAIKESKEDSLPFDALLSTFSGYSSLPSEFSGTSNEQFVDRPLICQEKYELVQEAANFVTSKLGDVSLKAMVFADAIYLSEISSQVT
jgi:hypothetical protein